MNDMSTPRDLTGLKIRVGDKVQSRFRDDLPIFTISEVKFAEDGQPRFWGIRDGMPRQTLLSNDAHGHGWRLVALAGGDVALTEEQRTALRMDFVNFMDEVTFMSEETFKGRITRAKAVLKELDIERVSATETISQANRIRAFMDAERSGMCEKKAEPDDLSVVVKSLAEALGVSPEQIVPVHVDESGYQVLEMQGFTCNHYEQGYVDAWTEAMSAIFRFAVTGGLLINDFDSPYVIIPENIRAEVISRMVEKHRLSVEEDTNRRLETMCRAINRRAGQRVFDVEPAADERDDDDEDDQPVKKKGYGCGPRKPRRDED